MTFTSLAALSPVALMRLTEIDDPKELEKFSKDKIVVEQKLDGHKVQVIKQKGTVNLFSRRGEELTNNFPLIVKAISIPDDTLVEGELVYVDKGKQDIGIVTSLSGSSPEKAIEKAKSLSGKIELYLYDILWVKGKNVTEKSFSERRKLLEAAVKTSDIIHLTKQYPFSKWQEAMKTALQSGGEGVVFKIQDAKYHWKPKGESEPKPANVMFKLKRKGGKSEEDDYVVYDYEIGEGGKLKALFGQYYKGVLYHISELSNFSKEVEEEIKKKLKKGPFTILIGFQERVPKGLRHQKYVKMREEKAPKDATMDEFHVKHLDNFEPVKMGRKAMFAFAATAPSATELITTLEQAGMPEKAPMGQIGGFDGDKMFRIISKLESNGRTDVVGDSGTSFGPTQVHAPYLLSRLSGTSGAEAATGMSSAEMKTVSSSWLEGLNKLRKTKIWKEYPIDKSEVVGTPTHRLEKTFIRMPNKVVEKRGDQYIAREIDLDTLRSLGFDTDSEYFRRTLAKAYSTYITDNVILSALAQAYVLQKAPEAFQKYQHKFNAQNIRKDKAMSNLLEKASMADFASRITKVTELVQQSGYNTTASGAFTLPQLIVIANASGIGAVQRFLMNKVPFGKGQLHYLQSSRVQNTLDAMRKTEPELSDIIDQLLVGLPPEGGKAGFSRFSFITEDIPRIYKIVMAAYNPKSPEHVTLVRAKKLLSAIEKWLNGEHEATADLRSAGVPFLMINRNTNPHRLEIWATGDENLLRKMLPKKFWGMEVLLHGHTPAGTPDEWEFAEEEPTIVDVEARMPASLYMAFFKMLRETREALKQEGKFVPEDELRRTVLLHVGEQLGYSKEKLDKLIGQEGWFRAACSVSSLSKRAYVMGTLAFPGNYAEDIKSGKMERTIRLADMPIEAEEVVMAVTYSGSQICRIKILSKESMSLPRIEKAFGKHVARSLEHKFGPNRRFVVIKFVKFNENAADDGSLDEKKKGEILIDKDGVKLTRGQIYDHYTKPAVRKQIMARIKGKPILVYLGIGKNEKILKRNHDGKQIVITNDDPKGSENSDNYWYWITRRLLSIHEVFGPKTDIGFVDLDLHDGYPIEKAKEYAKKAAAAIKEKYGVTSKIYQSGGTGLHVEFELKEPVSIDKLRKELRELLDELNKDFEGATTGVVKGKGMRTDVSTLHSKGTLRVPSSLGETYGKEKKTLSQDTDDNYGNNNYGKYTDNDTGPFGDGGAITPVPYQGAAPGQVGALTAARKELFSKVGK